MAVSLIPIIIQGVIKLAPPSVAKFLMQHGFKKASQTAVRGKTNIPKVSSKQAKDIVNKDQQTSFSLSKNMSKKDIQKMKNRLQDYGISDKKPVKPGRSITPKKVEDIGPFEWVAKKGQEHQKTLEKYKSEFRDRYKIDISDWSEERIRNLGRQLELRRQGKSPFVDESLQQDLIKSIKSVMPKAKTKAKEVTSDPTLQKFLESSPRKMKRGGRVGKPKGVGAAQRGYGKAMKRGK